MSDLHPATPGHHRDPGPRSDPAPLAEDEVDAYYSLLEPEEPEEPQKPEKAALPAPTVVQAAPPGDRTPGDGHQEKEEVGKFGWGGCNPAPLQPLASMHLFVILFFAITFVSGFQGSYTIAVLTTLEKTFNLPSSVSGLVVTISSLGYMATILFIAQLGRGGHIPKIMATSSLGVATSAVLYVMPFFIYGTGDTYLDQSDGGELHPANYSTDLSRAHVLTQYCHAQDVTSSNRTCDVTEEESSDMTRLVAFNVVAFGLFVAAEIVAGVAGSPFWSLGITYLDESVGRRLASKLIGVMYTVRFMAPVISFLLGAYFLTLHASLQETSLTPEHPRWVGAWHLGYLICAVTALLVFIPMSMLPKQLKNIADDSREAEAYLPKAPGSEASPADHSHFDNLRDMPKSIARLACNPVYLMTVLGLMVDVLCVGFIIFLPKYLEVQFNMPAWSANIFGGMLPALAGGIASFISGQMASSVREQDSSSGFCKMTVVCSAFSVLTILACLGLGCDPIQMSTPADNFHSADLGMCDVSSNCSCRADVFDPVCGGGEVYLSPCHAGCPVPSFYNNTYQNQTLSDCSCVPGGFADRGVCDNDCFAFLAMFMVVSYTSVFLLNLYNVPVTNTCLRSVNKEDKPMAFAVLMFLCSFVALPAPVIFGDLIDSTCLVHKMAPPCSINPLQKGACLLYDRVDFKNKLFTVTVIVKVIATVFYIIPWVVAKRRENKIKSKPPEKNKEALSVEMQPLREKHTTNNTSASTTKPNGRTTKSLGKSMLNSEENGSVC